MLRGKFIEKVLHPYNASTKKGSEELAKNSQVAIDKLLAQKLVVSSSYGGKTMLKDSLRNVQPKTAPSIRNAKVTTTSSGERIENGSNSLVAGDQKNVELADQRAQLVGGVVKEVLPKGTKVKETSQELEFTRSQIDRLVEIGHSLKIQGFTERPDLDIALEVLKRVNSGSLKNQEVIDMVANMRKTEISVTIAGKVDNIQNIGIPILIPAGILGLTLATRWAFNNIRMPEISLPTLSCPKPNFKLSCFPCEGQKNICKLPPCVKGIDCCKIPKLDCASKEKFDLFKPKEIRYDRFMPNHMNQAVINDGFDLSHIIDSYIVQTTTLQNRIRSRNYSATDMATEYQEVITNIGNLLAREYREYSRIKQRKIDISTYQGENITDFRAHSYVENFKTPESNREYMDSQARMLAQMIMRSSNRFRVSTPCFIGARVKAAIRADQMNRF